MDANRETIIVSAEDDTKRAIVMASPICFGDGKRHQKHQQTGLMRLQDSPSRGFDLMKKKGGKDRTHKRACHCDAIDHQKPWYTVDTRTVSAGGGVHETSRASFAKLPHFSCRGKFSAAPKQPCCQ